jgi:hypothetical protein
MEHADLAKWHWQVTASARTQIKFRRQLSVGSVKAWDIAALSLT